MTQSCIALSRVDRRQGPVVDPRRINELHSQQNRIALINEETELIYDSLRDQAFAVFWVEGSVLVDHCLPRNQAYALIAVDNQGDGFNAGGKVEIYLDRVLVETIEGNFGDSITVEIAAESVPTPAPAPSPTPEPAPVRHAIPSCLLSCSMLTHSLTHKNN